MNNELNQETRMDAVEAIELDQADIELIALSLPVQTNLKAGATIVCHGCNKF